MASTMFLFPLLLLSFLELVGATHFAYAVIQWNCVSGCPYTAGSTTNRNYSIVNTFGYRISFPWYNNGAQIAVGSIVNPGDLLFYPMMASGTPRAISGPIALKVQTLFTNDDWFLGTYALNFVTTVGYTQWHWRSYFSNCCRLSSIRDKNNDVPWTITGIYNRYSTVSPIASGLPRVYVQQYQPLIYQVPFLSPSGAPIVISLAQKLDSTLNTPTPMDPPQPRNTSFKYNKTTGTCYWTPQVTGLYAIAFFVEEICTTPNSDVPCADSGLQGTGSGTNGSGSTTTNCCSRIPLDFIFEVDPSCYGQPNCVNPPYFFSPFPANTDPSLMVWYFYRGIQGGFQICAKDDSAGQIVSIGDSIPPSTSSLTPAGPDGQTTCQNFAWAPTLTDQNSILCAVATATPGYRGNPLHNSGQYCIKLIILDTSTLVVSGIVRDFHYYHPNFNRSYADCRQCLSTQNPIQNSWVANLLDANHMPVFSPQTGPGIKQPVSAWASGLSDAANTTFGFYDWWQTDTAITNPRNVQVPISIILSAGQNANQAIFTFLSSAFFPIDNQGFGNEGSSHNFFYTYEVNTYITYQAVNGSTGVAQTMNVAAQDDLWIFIDNVLAPNWNQHGIKPINTTSGLPYDYTIYMSQLIGSDNNSLVNGETYRCDIFYANRFGIPYLKIELPNNTLCTQLTSGQYAFNWTSFTGVQMVDGSQTTNIPPTGLFYYAATATSPPTITSVTPPGATAATKALLLPQTSQGASVCYGTPLKALHGFIGTFTFFVNNPNKNLFEGLAFILDSYPYFRGNVGSELGYGGIRQTFAVEIDASQSAALSDPDFTTCCGLYPYWTSAAPGWGSTLPWGQIAYHAYLTPSGGSYPPNDASEIPGSGALLPSGSSSGKIALDFKNGSLYTIKVVYQPAQDDGTSNPQPGWFWTYANQQLEPIAATQVDGVALRAMLGGKTTVCLTYGTQWNPNTNSNPAGNGADIYIVQWSMLVVPTDAGSTQIISAQILGQPAVIGVTKPISPMVAGSTSTVTVRARDACGNPITVGGELDQFTCNVVKQTCPGAPINCTGVDNGDGTYTFSFAPTIASPNYQLFISFGPPGQQLAIQGSPYPFVVVAAPASIDTSIAVFGQLPELLYNGGNDPFNGVLSQFGIFAARFSQYGRWVASQMFDFSGTNDTYNIPFTTPSANLIAFIATRQSTEYLLIAVSGSNLLTSEIAAAANNAGGVKSVGGAVFGNIQPGNTYALITRPGNQPTCNPSCEWLSTTSGSIKITARGTDTSSVSFTRYFTLTAASANTACGPWAVLNSIFDDIRVPAGTNNQFTIQARDIYYNLNPVTGIQATFQPDLVPSTNGALIQSPLFPSDGYFYYPFYSEKAGLFFLYTSLNGAGANIRYGNGSSPYAAYPVLIDPGVANITNSYCQGAVLTSATAGTMATFQLVLFDRWGNQITFQNPADNITATLIYRNAPYTVVTQLNTSWQDGSCGPKCVLYASFYPTLASVPNTNLQFDVNLTINGIGNWKICGSPDIVPGPLSPANSTFNISGIVPAGTQTSFTITTRDRFGNQRRTPTATGDQINVNFGSSVSGYTLTYQGNGLYSVSFVPQTKGSNQITVLVTSNGQGDVKTAGNSTIGTGTLKVIPGPASANSTIGGISNGQVVIAGTLNQFTLVSYDHYLNLRDNQPFGIVVANATDYFYRLNDPMKGIDAQIMIAPGSQYATTGTFNYQYNATLIGNYTLTLTTTPVVAQPQVEVVNNTPLNVIVIPNCTYPQNTIFSGPGLGGGISQNQTYFLLTARDYFTNQQADYHDSTLYTVTIFDGTNTQNPLVNPLSPTPGNFIVNYTVPTNPSVTQQPLVYTVTVCHSGMNSSGTPNHRCFPQWCTTFNATSISTNRIFNGTIAVTNGSAGTQMNWTISDIDIHGAPATGQNIVTSWLVTVTRINPNDGAPAAQSISVSCFKNASGLCETSPGVYTNVTFTPTINIGDFVVKVYAYGVETEQSKAGITVHIGPGPVWPPNCVVYNLSATEPAGVAQQYQVALNDQWYHPITDNTLSVLATLTPPAGVTASPVSLTGSFASTSGLWVFTYTLNLTGVWPVTTWETKSQANGNGNIGNQLTITVNPGPASCLTSYIKGVILAGSGVFATAGSVSSFTVVPLDQFGNAVVDTTTHLDLADNGSPMATFTQSVVPAANPPAIDIQVTYLPTKVVTPNNIITVGLGGTCHLMGTIPVLGDSNPQQSPLNVIVNPSNIYPPYCSYGGNQATIMANNSLTLSLTLVDQYNNSWFPNNTQAIIGFVTNSNGLQLPTVTSAVGGGVYNLMLDPSATQTASMWNDATQTYLKDYSWLVEANGVPISGSGSSLLNIPNSTVTSGWTAAFNTIPPTLYDMTSDVPRTYQVILQDAFGNRRWTGAGTDVIGFTWIDGTVFCTLGEELPPSDSTAITTQTPTQTYIGDGEFNVTIVGTVVGAFTLNLTVTPSTGPMTGMLGYYGQPDCSPTSRLVQHVLPGAAYPPTSWWTIDNHVVNAGDSVHVFVQVNDKEGNAIGRSGTYLAWGTTVAPNTPAAPPAAYPPTGADLSTLTPGWMLSAMNTWVDPSFTASAPTLPISPPSVAPIASQYDFTNSSYTYTITFYKSGNSLPLVLGMLNASNQWVAVPWPSNLATDGGVTVLPGPPRQFSPNTTSVAQLLQNQKATAAIPTSFSVTAYDNYGNPVAMGSNASFDVVMRLPSNGYTVPITPVAMGNGVYQFNFLSAWAGNFDLLITLHPNDGTPDITPQGTTVTILGATCAAQNPGTSLIYRCPDGTCQTSYSACSSIPTGTCGVNNAMQTTCSDGSCAASAALCPCTGNLCASGNCLPAAQSCPPANAVCSGGLYMCTSNGQPTGQCRQSSSDCPSPAVCPPGYVVCSTGTSCGRNASDCAANTVTVTCPPNTYQCPTGTCGATSSDCPTPVTCPSNMVHCLTDGSCQVDAAHCPAQYQCYTPNTFRCPDGTCTTDVTQCPAPITCPAGYVLCSSGACVSTVGNCPKAQVCPAALVQCPDGSCENNMLFCSSITSCEPATPVRCWDGSCVTNAVECSSPQACPGTENVTCPGGACSTSFALCPTGTTCPSDMPVLCPDGSCQATKAVCTAIPTCPTDQPVRCPDGQSCRGSRADCPTIVTCPSGSVKCSDGTCALALDKCAPAVNCPTNMLRCPGGECVSGTTALCPTHETCPAGYGKCLDGTCRTQCPLSYQTCPAGQVTCPQAAAGVQCALNLTSCPQQPTCPPGYPVRCTDASCQTTVLNCPTPPTTYPNNKIPCGDGTWATTISNCPTPLTCPAATPAKCTDNSCRVTASDCPLTTLCASSTPYLCSTGACVANPWDPACTSASQPCPLTAPVSCPPYGNTGPTACVANVSYCDAVPNPLNCTGLNCTICGTTQTYCRSGACVSGPDNCPPVGCDPSIPYQCQDGSCTANIANCPNNVGCPAQTAPQRCPQTGLCVKNANDVKQCPTNLACPVAGWVWCPDGSCAANNAQCPLPNGCPANVGLPIRCYDGSCVPDYSYCNATNYAGYDPTNKYPFDPYPAMCAPENPYKCADGYCAKTSTACPPQMVNLGCTSPTPIQCAVGSCVGSALQCPPLNPTCPTGTVRCQADASCRLDANACPVYVNPACVYRCDTGLCVPAQTYCTSSNTFSGCPGGTSKCPQTGECVANTANCVVLSQPNGCPASMPVKCTNGACMANQTSCMVGPSGSCPQATPILCPNGVCATSCPVGTPTTCPSGSPVRCPDGTCAANNPSCNAYNGCPVSTPYRCVDGSCAKHPATSNAPGSCPISVICSSGLYLCMDGGCVSSPTFCQPLLCQSGLSYCNFGCYANCNSTSARMCPSKSPILCNSGACVASLALCGASPTGGQANTGCQSPNSVVCSLGSCVKNQNQCPLQTGQANGAALTSTSQTQGENANIGCASGEIMCPDGQCVLSSRAYACRIIPACPYNTYRWWDGTCQSSSSNYNPVSCLTTTSVRCEDGWCRDHKLPYDGCSNNQKAWFQCPDRNCADSPNSCASVATGNPDTYPRFDTSCEFQYGACRRLLSTYQRPNPCVPSATVECNAATKAGGAAQLISATIDISQTQTLPIALNNELVTVASLTIPSGSLSLTNGASTTSISIRAVADSRVRYAVNEIVPSRSAEFGSYLDYPLTVLSVAFECVLPPEVEPTFTLNFTYTAWIDLTPPTIDYQDVCLAVLVELQGFSTWECLISDRNLRGNATSDASNFYVHKSGAPSQEVTSVFQTCAPSSAPGVISPYNGSVYAFIFSPLPDVPTAPAGLDVVQRNIVWIVLGILLGFALLILLAYCAFRLFRYREKYHTEREEADRLQEEVENMKQFGGDSGNKDDQVAMTANPLAVQLKDVQARYNEEEMKLQQAEASLRKQEGEIRAQHIDNMRENRNKLAQELEKLKSQLAEAQAASQPKATFEQDEGPTYTGDEPVREEFDSGSTAVAPKRGKKDL